MKTSHRRLAVPEIQRIEAALRLGEVPEVVPCARWVSTHGRARVVVAHVRVAGVVVAKVLDGTRRLPKVVEVAVPWVWMSFSLREYVFFGQNDDHDEGARQIVRRCFGMERF